MVSRGQGCLGVRSLWHDEDVWELDGVNARQLTQSLPHLVPIGYSPTDPDRTRDSVSKAVAPDGRE